MDADRRAKLEATTRYEPGEVERRLFAGWFEAGYFTPEAGGNGRGELLAGDPAAERHRVAAHGARPQQHDPGRARAARADAGAADEVDPRHRPRRDRHAVGGREGAPPARASTATSSAARPSSSGSGEWREQYGGQIIEQLKRLGASCDYANERFTLDEGYVRAVYRVFVGLYEKGYIYRDNYMVNWDPGSRSAISDLEVENREVTDTLYSIDYPVEGGDRVLTVATVRPETMLADTAVAVHPDDERYAGLVGGHCVLPLVGRRLPIIADPYVDPEFGTGALKITPGHDPNDFEIGRSHGLEEISVIGEDGLMNEAAGADYAGLEHRRGPGAGRRRAARAGQHLRRGALRALGPLLAPLGRADRAADQPAVVLRDGRARQAGDRGRAGRPRHLHARALGPGLPRLDGEDPPLVRLPTALVGPPAAGLVLRLVRGDDRRRERARARASPAAGPCAGTRTSSTPGSPRRCGRSRRSAGPTTPPSCAPSTRPTCSRRRGTSSTSGSPG